MIPFPGVSFSLFLLMLFQVTPVNKKTDFGDEMTAQFLDYHLESSWEGCRLYDSLKG
jgi:hypothetical protein